MKIFRKVDLKIENNDFRKLDLKIENKISCTCANDTRDLERRQLCSRQ